MQPLKGVVRCVGEGSKAEAVSLGTDLCAHLNLDRKRCNILICFNGFLEACFGDKAGNRPVVKTVTGQSTRNI